MDGPPIIEARALVKRFGMVPALSGVDLELGRGESVALFGPNGAGKTTLIRILTLELRPTSGTLRLAGRDPAEADLWIKRRSGVISHRPLLYDELSGRENLRFFGRLYGVSDAAGRADALLERLGLAARGDDLFRTYSRGMQQRLAVARCLIHDPELVYLDEPFSGLDTHAARVLRETLDGLRRSGRTMLLVTHNVREGLELCDRWLVLERGRVVDGGRSADTDDRRFEEAYRARLGAAATARGGPR